MKVRLLVLVLLVGLGVMAVGINVSGKASQRDEYETAIASAHSNADRDIPYTSVRQFKKAFSVRCTDEAEFQLYIEQCSKLGEDFYSAALEEYIDFFPQSIEAYERLCQYHYDEENYTKVIQTTMASRDAGVSSEKLKNWYYECFYMFEHVRSEMEEAGAFLGGKAIIKQDGKCGYIDEDGDLVLANAYDIAYPFLSASTSVKADGIWVMINSDGYVVARPEKDVDDMSFVSDGKVVIAKGRKYGYTDTTLKVPDDLPYDYASAYRNGVAAVKVGNEWKLIDTEGKSLTETVFEDIKIDEFHTCLSSGVIWAKKNGKYYMYDAEGKQICDQGFEDARHFVADEPAAVSVGGKWGFVDKTGQMVIEAEYTDARSFNCGVGAVCVDGLWGYVSIGNEIRIAPQFEDAREFSSDGIAAVKENESWSYIKLLGFDR